MDRRTIVKAGAVLAGSLGLPAYLRAQTSRKLSILTWNISDQEALFREEFTDFQKLNPGVEIEWLDKKGPELPAFYQTQLVAGTAPDIVDLQGAIWVEWAANGALLDLTPYLARDPEVAKLYNPDYLQGFAYNGKTFVIPFYVAKTLLYYNKIMFKEAGLSGPPTSFDEILSFSQAMAKGEKTGFLTLNFDWLYWPLFKMNGVELLKPDLKTPAVNTPETAAMLDKLAKATQSGAINKVAWTGRWVEPNGAFAAGNVGMLQAHSASYFFVKGQGPWVNGDTLGAVQAPGNWSTPTNHGLAVSKTSKHPELAFALVKHMTGNKWATEFSTRRRILTGNVAADAAGLAKVKAEDPLAHAVLETQLAHTDKMTGNWPLPNDAQVKDAFWPEIQNALLGRKDAKTALNDAERAVVRVMRRS
ncbi:ABC transporter substrate-binding protein [Phreatobacter stygius]|uniref:Sugar ABC transporter substrate-binding protein n=1 Tax=Phreatobacter stygius TaxID=1940610 RepID=A0A4D7B830_9HYPH|nr:sugar ABC transporter substrate-binding protein [Phreatobacter stygius]QCI67013.1 sugar ABC transporter substrate-binding protein [Phreatobacter stygius]